MTDSSEDRRKYLSYIHLKEIEMVLTDLVTFVERQVSVDNLAAAVGNEVPEECKKKYIVSTFQLTGDLSYEDAKGKVQTLDEKNTTFSLAVNLDVAISFSASMLGFNDAITKTYVDDARYDSDMQDATKEIFNLANGSLEKVLRRELDISATCSLLSTELVDFSTDKFPEFGDEIDFFSQDVKVEGLEGCKIIQLIPKKLGEFFCRQLTLSKTLDEVAEFIESSGGIQAGSKKVEKKAGKVIVKRIMVVDDTYLIRQLLTEHLRSYGFSASERSDGVSAVKRAYLMGESLTLVLLDLKLPDMSGFKVLEELKRNPRTKHVKVIICSSISDKDDVVKAFKLGASDYIVKPFNRETILGKVVKAIGRPE